jgi:hypothetical protein
MRDFSYVVSGNISPKKGTKIPGEMTPGHEYPQEAWRAYLCAANGTPATLAREFNIRPKRKLLRSNLIKVNAISHTSSLKLARYVRGAILTGSGI